LSHLTGYTATSPILAARASSSAELPGAALFADRDARIWERAGNFEEMFPLVCHSSTNSRLSQPRFRSYSSIMRPDKKIIEEFIRLYEAEFHEPITEAEASEMWTRVMDLYLVLYRREDEEQGGQVLHADLPRVPKPLEKTGDHPP
jgi:hypothetical protein